MTISQLLLQLMNSLTYAGLLFMVSVGFSLIFGVVRVVNMTHGAFYLLGAYIGYFVQKITGSWYLGILAGTLFIGGVSILLNFLVEIARGELPQTLLTLGLSLFIGDLCLWIWGGLPLSLEPPDYLRQLAKIGIIEYPTFRLIVLVVSIFIGGALWAILYRTKLGMIIRAGVDNREMVSALGININNVFLIVFVLGGILVGLSGVLGGSYLAFGPGTDFIMLTYALVVVVIGGMGSLSGSLVAALLIAVIDTFGRIYISNASIFLISATLLIVISIRPQGLFGRNI